MSDHPEHKGREFLVNFHFGKINLEICQRDPWKKKKVKNFSSCGSKMKYCSKNRSRSTKGWRSRGPSPFSHLDCIACYRLDREDCCWKSLWSLFSKQAGSSF